MSDPGPVEFFMTRTRTHRPYLTAWPLTTPPAVCTDSRPREISYRLPPNMRALRLRRVVIIAGACVRLSYQTCQTHKLLVTWILCAKHGPICQEHRSPAMCVTVSPQGSRSPCKDPSGQDHRSSAHRDSPSSPHPCLQEHAQTMTHDDRSDTSQARLPSLNSWTTHPPARRWDPCDGLSPEDPPAWPHESRKPQPQSSTRLDIKLRHRLKQHSVQTLQRRPPSQAARQCKVHGTLLQPLQTASQCHSPSRHPNGILYSIQF